ncbi:YgaP family membrane protein [Sulfurimonas sp.]|uniref:YgaP family membrane protein n=1 Tax=Sulfurimonas sp. TaxID=2022749 RepID=UPI003D0A9689
MPFFFTKGISTTFRIGIVYEYILTNVAFIIPLGTALLGWCPLYWSLQISTCRNKWDN